MNKTPKILFVLSLALAISAFATAHFGVDYELNQIPAERRAKMADFDWIGAEWVFRGMLLLIIALIAALAGAASWIMHRRKNN